MDTLIDQIAPRLSQVTRSDSVEVILQQAEQMIENKQIASTSSSSTSAPTTPLPLFGRMYIYTELYRTVSNPLAIESLVARAQQDVLQFCKSHSSSSKKKRRTKLTRKDQKRQLDAISAELVALMDNSSINLAQSRLRIETALCALGIEDKAAEMVQLVLPTREQSDILVKCMQMQKKRGGQQALPPSYTSSSSLDDDDDYDLELESQEFTLLQQTTRM